MNSKIILQKELEEFRQYLIGRERSHATVEKYFRDVTAFYLWLPIPKTAEKEVVMAYKQEILKKYSVNSVNSMLASVNNFLSFSGRANCMVRSIRTQKALFCSSERELTKDEYLRLLRTAKSAGNVKLDLMMQTICSTGIRISELVYITVEAVKRGRAVVNCKNKIRTIMLPQKLQALLLRYSRSCRIESGVVFVTRTGRPMNRSNVWSAMKRLCETAHVAASKVFPHNLRHLFAKTFYGRTKDLGRLADVLGHSTIETTRIYMVSTGQEHMKQMDSLGLVVSASESP